MPKVGYVYPSLKEFIKKNLSGTLEAVEYIEDRVLMTILEKIGAGRVAEIRGHTVDIYTPRYHFHLFTLAKEYEAIASDSGSEEVIEINCHYSREEIEKFPSELFEPTLGSSHSG